MKKILLFTVFASVALSSHAQSIDSLINADEVASIENVLASDSLKGRAVFTDDIEKASSFIEKEFAHAGLQPFSGATGFRQPFFITHSENTLSEVTIDGESIPDSLVAVTSFQPEFSITDKDAIHVVTIGSGDDLREKIMAVQQSKENQLVLLDASFNGYRDLIKVMGSNEMTPPQNTVVFVFGKTAAQRFSIKLRNKISRKPLNNVVGILPGKTRPGEYVIFSAHYDHLGVGAPVNGDSIYNGANDDASGTAAVITLARYFKAQNNNVRTLVFAAFTAEETGEYGSQYFSARFDPEKVVAMFNIEMIGTESKWGKNSAYITGFDKTDMGKILMKNLAGSPFTFYADPYSDQNLFYRSDNASLAMLGVPAHTISTSKMDNEPHYHEPGDEISTLNPDNMAEIIKAIALSSASIIKGTDTPTRVDTTQLR